MNTTAENTSVGHTCHKPMLSASASVVSLDNQVSSEVRRLRCVLETVVIGDGTPNNPYREQYSIFRKGKLLHKFDSADRYSLFELKNHQRGISPS